MNSRIFAAKPLPKHVLFVSARAEGAKCEAAAESVGIALANRAGSARLPVDAAPQQNRRIYNDVHAE